MLFSIQNTKPEGRISELISILSLQTVKVEMKSKLKKYSKTVSGRSKIIELNNLPSRLMSQLSLAQRVPPYRGLQVERKPAAAVPGRELSSNK